MKLAIIAASLILAGSAPAQSLKAKYELSERCAKWAKEVFEKDWGTGVYSNPADQYWIIGSYENHYNSRLNKCFYIEIEQIHNRGQKLKMMILRDLNENIEIAGYSRVEGQAFVLCSVQGKEACKSEEEWRALIKPFMED